jgi:hypothetical protein
MDNQLKIKLTIKFETTYLFDYFKHEKLSTIFLLVLFISQMNGQKIDSLTIDKSCLTEFYCTNSSFDWWYLSIKLQFK